MGCPHPALNSGEETRPDAPENAACGAVSGEVTPNLPGFADLAAFLRSRITTRNPIRKR